MSEYKHQNFDIFYLVYWGLSFFFIKFSCIKTV